MPNTLSVMYLKSESHGNKELLRSWTQCETMIETMTPGTTPTYDKYFKYLLRYTKKLEVVVANNTPSRKANSSESNYLTPYSP